MVLTQAQIRDYSTQLNNQVINSDLKNFLDSQGSLNSISSQIRSLTDATRTFNQEFNERHAMMGGTYQLPLFGTNQDIVLLGFYFSYIFLTLVSLFTVYKNTQSIQNVLYGFCLAGVLLLIITGLLFKIA